MTTLKEPVALRPREKEILHLVAQYRTNGEIASELNLRYGTIRNAVSDIMRLLGIHERPHLIQYAQENGYGAKVSPSKHRS